MGFQAGSRSMRSEWLLFVFSCHGPKVNLSRLYYQYQPDQLPFCLLIIHAVLHIPNSIENSGPVWVLWEFPTEHFCGCILPAICSCRYPFANLDNYIITSAQLAQIKIKYNLFDKLSLKHPKSAEIANSFLHTMCKLIFWFAQSSNLIACLQIQHASCYIPEGQVPHPWSQR
jgi:hypothetical protein